MDLGNQQNPAELNQRLLLQAPTLVSDGAGGFTTTWVTIATIWAAVWPISASERLSNMEQIGEVTHRVRIRFRGGIKISWRFKWGTTYLNITAQPINLNSSFMWLDILCREVN